MLSASQRTALLQYKYSGVDNSLVSRFLLQPWWNWLVKRFPLWVAYVPNYLYNNKAKKCTKFDNNRPNLITLAGFLLVVANVLLMFYYSPDLSTPCPQWGEFSILSFFTDILYMSFANHFKRIVYFSFAIGLFIYQSFDAIDGKQGKLVTQPLRALSRFLTQNPNPFKARRTGASSPLGELFDHGCDALNTTLMWVFDLFVPLWSS